MINITQLNDKPKQNSRIQSKLYIYSYETFVKKNIKLYVYGDAIIANKIISSIKTFSGKVQQLSRDRIGYKQFIIQYKHMPETGYTSHGLVCLQINSKRFYNKYLFAMLFQYITENECSKLLGISKIVIKQLLFTDRSHAGIYENCPKFSNKKYQSSVTEMSKIS